MIQFIKRGGGGGTKAVLPNKIKFYGSKCTDMDWLIDVDLSEITIAGDLFEQCDTLIRAPQIDISNFQVCNYMFNQCTALETVPVYDLKSMTSGVGMFSGCTALTDESLNNIMASFATAEAYTGTKTLRNFGLRSNQCTTCTGLSNWPALQALGWTTGW